MRITSEKLELTPSEVVLWGEIKTMRLLNDKLDLILKNGKVLSLNNLKKSSIDLIFRTYETYLTDHPEKRQYMG